MQGAWLMLTLCIPLTVVSVFLVRKIRRGMQFPIAVTLTPLELVVHYYDSNRDEHYAREDIAGFRLTVGSSGMQNVRSMTVGLVMPHRERGDVQFQAGWLMGECTAENLRNNPVLSEVVRVYNLGATEPIRFENLVEMWETPPLDEAENNDAQQQDENVPDNDLEMNRGDNEQEPNESADSPNEPLLGSMADHQNNDQELVALQVESE